MKSLMTRWIAVLAAAAASFLAVPMVAAQSAAGGPDAVIHKEVAQAITEARKQAERKHWDAALTALRTAERSPQKSEYAEYKIQ